MVVVAVVVVVVAAPSDSTFSTVAMAPQGMYNPVQVLLHAYAYAHIIIRTIIMNTTIDYSTTHIRNNNNNKA